MAVDFRESFAKHWQAYERTHGAAIPRAHLKAARAILACRTPALGGSLYRCGDCRKTHYSYHSCNHRLCPQCGYQDAMAWADKQKDQLLPVAHAMVTFTIPEDLRCTFRSHQTLCYKLLFQCSAQALQDIASHKRHLGATLGMLGVLHTWTRQLEYHPHIHYLVPMGGLSPQGKWKQPKSPDYFLPVKALSIRMRTLMQAAMREDDPILYKTIAPSIWRAEWITHIQPVGGGETALGYLARYISQSALSSKRILADDGKSLTIAYTESGTGQKKTLRLSGHEFIRRLMQHVLPKSFKRVRYYGWLSPAAHKRRDLIRELLAWKPCQREEAPTSKSAPCCPHCQGVLKHILSWHRNKAPPVGLHCATPLYG